MASLLTLRGNAFGDLIDPLPRGVVEQRLRDAGGFQLHRQAPLWPSVATAIFHSQQKAEFISISFMSLPVLPARSDMTE